MKRVLYLMLAVVMGALLLAPLSFSGGMNVASAATTCAPAADGKCATGPVGGPADACVKVALKIFDNDASCVKNDKASGGAIVNYLRLILKLLSGVVGLLIILMLVVAGVQYMTSLGDPGRVKSAKDRIVNAITALVLFLTMFAILNFLIPGGILS